VLRESEVRTDGAAPGRVGSRIVAETVVGQLRRDPRSYSNRAGWSPAAGVRLLDGATVTWIAALRRPRPASDRKDLDRDPVAL
jgi:hypothetical protein